MNSVIGLIEGTIDLRNVFGQIYSVVPEEHYHSDLGKYRTYGIQVTGPDSIDIIHDVSVCKNTVNDIVELFNRHQLSPVHLYDAVEDMLP